MGKFLGIDWRKAAKIAAPIAGAYDPTGTITRVLNRLGDSKKVDSSLARGVASDTRNDKIIAGTEIALGGLTLADPYLKELAGARYESSEYAKQAKRAQERVAEQYESIREDLERKRREVENMSELAKADREAVMRVNSERKGNLIPEADRTERIRRRF